VSRRRNYITLPITGAWLFGFRAALRIAGFCVGSSLAMALLELFGLRLPLYFSAEPFAVWMTVMAAAIMTTVLVARVLQITQVDQILQVFDDFEETMPRLLVAPKS
jgi:hypothetical protein